MKLGKYRGLQVKMPDLTITKQEVDRALRNLQSENSVLTHVDDRPARFGDYVILDMYGTIAGKPFRGSRRSHYAMTIGTHRYFPGFDEKIVGHCLGETFSFAADFPADYPIVSGEKSCTAGSGVATEEESLAVESGAVAGEESQTGKPGSTAEGQAPEPFVRKRTIARFVVTITTLGRMEIPKLNDEFALDFSEYDTLEELRESLSESLEEKKLESEEARVRRDLLSQIIETSEFEMEEETLAELEEEYLTEFEEKLQEQALTLEEFFNRTNRTIEDIEADCRRRAVRSLSETAVLTMIAEREHITLTEDDVSDAIADTAEYYGMDPEEFSDSLDEEEMKGFKLELLCDRAMELVMEEAIYL